MATTGTKLTIPFTVGAGALVGQGTQPELWVLYSTDDASVKNPAWTTAHQGGGGDVRAFTTARGRENELAAVDAGTATLTLNNRSRTYDPIINTGIRPLNRWWIREQFTGETQDILKGYATSYEQQRPDPLTDAITIVNCVDEFGVLALGALPVTDPPRDTYQEVVMFDSPNAYWTFNVEASFVMSPFESVVGPQLIGNSFGLTGPGPIMGGEGPAHSSYYKGVAATLVTPALTTGEGGDVSGLSEFAVETWYQTANLTTGAGDILKGPTAGGASTWRLYINAAGQVSIEARNGAGAVVTATAPAAFVLQINTWYHIVGTITGGNLRIYINAAQANAIAFTAPFAATIDANAFLRVGDVASTDFLAAWDEIAVYRAGLSASRVLAHYTASQRGFFVGDTPHLRAIALLDTMGSAAPRQIRVGTRLMTGERMKAQAPLEPLRDCADAEAPDGLLFVGRDGSIVLFDAAYRAASPWNTVQATFDDDGTDLPYHALTLDYSEAFLANEWNVTPRGGVVATASDSTSISRYFKRPQSLSDIPIVLAADATTIAAALLAKYKDPFQRVTSLRLSTAQPAVTEAMFRRDIGDRIEVFGTPPGGGARIDQTLFIQKITVNGDPRGPWSVTWAVSPL